MNPATGGLLVDSASLSGAFVQKTGDTMTGALLFNPSVVTSGAGVFIKNSSYTTTVPNGSALTLVDMTFHNTQTVNQNGLFSGIQITTDSDAVDTAAGIRILNNGQSDALYIRVAGKSGSTLSNPTGLGMDVNRSGLNENATNNQGYGIQVWDWSQTDTQNQTPAMLYLSKHNNVDTHHLLSLFNTNRNALRITVPQGGAYTGVEPLIEILGGGAYSQRLIITANGSVGQGPNIPLLGIETLTKIGVRSTGTGVSTYFDTVVSGEGRIVSQDGTISNNGRALVIMTQTGLTETARLSNTGLLGLGLNNPIYKADIYGSTRIRGGLYVDAISTPSTPVITPRGSITASALNAGGTGYLVNDVLSISGGTGGQITVNTVDGSGAILTYTLSAAGGNYVAATGASTSLVRGTGATFNTTISVGGALATVTLNNAGSNYIAGDTLLVSGGSGGIVTVNTVTAGAITTYTLTTFGSSYVAATGATTSLTSGGSGAKINVTTIATGSTTYGYKLTAVSAVGETIASTEGTTTTGNATLDTNNFNRIAWTAGTSGTVVEKYKVYRTTSGGTPSSTGLIATVTSPTLVLNDTGLSASGSAPIVDTTGNTGFGISSPTAIVHIKAGAAGVGQSPMKLTPGTNLSLPESGVIEYNGNLYATQAGAVRYAIGGTLFDHFVDAGNTHTDGATFDDLYTDTLLANTFNTNGDKVTAHYGGIFVSSATATREIKVLFAGSTILDTGSLTTATAESFDISVLLIRVSSTVARCIATIKASTTTGASAFNDTTYTEVTSLTLSNTNILKIIGVSGGTGAAISDIVAKLGSVSFVPAA